MHIYFGIEGIGEEGGRVDPVLPERARSECARSTAAVVSTRTSLLKRRGGRIKRIQFGYGEEGDIVARASVRAANSGMDSVSARRVGLTCVWDNAWAS